MTLYLGWRTPSGALVWVWDEGELAMLDPARHVWNHSPTGLEWGYQGSGPAQLALALLLHATERERIARDWHQAFKREVVGVMPKGGWALSKEDILVWLLGKILARPEVDTTSPFPPPDEPVDLADDAK